MALFYTICSLYYNSVIYPTICSLNTHLKTIETIIIDKTKCKLNGGRDVETVCDREGEGGSTNGSEIKREKEVYGYSLKDGVLTLH